MIHYTLKMPVYFLLGTIKIVIYLLNLRLIGEIRSWTFYIVLPFDNKRSVNSSVIASAAASLLLSSADLVLIPSNSASEISAPGLVLCWVGAMKMYEI